MALDVHSMIAESESQTIDGRQSVSILYEDEDLVAVAKPSGMFVHRSLADRSASEFLVQIVRDRIGCYVYPLHRLDRPTSGLVLLTKSREAAAKFGELLAQRRMVKTYAALVRGYAPEACVVDRPLTSSRGRKKEKEHPQAMPQPAETEIRGIERLEVPVATSRHPATRLTLLEAQPRTGRYHQIRRHLAGLGYPVIGDAEHGDSRLNRLLQQHVGITRLMLAATQLEFIHPVKLMALRIQCPLEPSFVSVLERIRGMSQTSPDKASVAAMPQADHSEIGVHFSSQSPGCSPES